MTGAEIVLLVDALLTVSTRLVSLARELPDTDTEAKERLVDLEARLQGILAEVAAYKPKEV